MTKVPTRRGRSPLWRSLGRWPDKFRCRAAEDRRGYGEREGSSVSALDLSRRQFGITTVYQFLFVPLTIGRSILVAGMQTAWFIKKHPPTCG